MNISQEELDRWEQTAVNVNGQILHALDGLRRGDLESAFQHLDNARTGNWNTRKSLLTVGARNSIEARATLSGLSSRGTDGRNLEPTLLQLTSPTNQRYCQLLHELYEIAIERDKERGWFPDGTATHIGDLLADAKLEVYGPAGQDENV
jgi:hypothetical protein